MGTERSKGFGLFSLSGHVTRPGQYEAPLGITLRELLDMAGGMRERQAAEVLDAGRVLDADRSPTSTSTCRSTSSRSRPRPGSMLGTRALQIFDETTCVVRAVVPLDRLLRARVLRQVHARAARAPTGSSRSCTGLEHGQGTEDDIDKLLDICDNILGRVVLRAR